MLSVKIITVGSLKESYLRDACAEYSKRLGSFCKLGICEIREAKLTENPSQKEIDASLDAEAKEILAQLSPRAYSIAMCVEGKQMPSEDFAKKLAEISQISSEICFVIGSSHGLSQKVKRACDFRMSVSELTFPHQLLRVILLESVYRAFNILQGTKYHK